MRERLDVGEAEPHEIWQLQRARARDVAQRVAAHVAILGGVGQFADPDAVEHDPDNAGELFAASWHWDSVQSPEQQPSEMFGQDSFNHSFTC